MSDIRANMISDAAGTGPIDLYKQSAAKAWVNFNGTGTIAARNSLNVASLTDNGTGDYSVNFTNNFAAADYSMLASGRELASWIPDGGVFSTSSFQIATVNTSFSKIDTDVVSSANHGDLA